MSLTEVAVIDVILRELLAATLAAGVVVKLLQPGPTRSSLRSLGVPSDWTGKATQALITVEGAFVGLLAVAPGAVAGLATAMLFASFALVVWKLDRESLSASCGCLPRLRSSLRALPLRWRLAGRWLGVVAGLLLATDPSLTWGLDRGRVVVLAAAALGAMLALFIDRHQRRPALTPAGWPAAPCQVETLVDHDPDGDDRGVSERGPVVHRAQAVGTDGLLHDFESWSRFRRDLSAVSGDRAKEVAKVTPALHGFSSTVRCDDLRGGAFCDRLTSLGAFGPPGSPPAVLARFLEQFAPGLESTAAFVDFVQAQMRAADQV